MSVWNLFITFLKIGLLSIGGGYAIIPLIQEQVVVNNSWISEKVFTDIITISQIYICRTSDRRNCRCIGRDHRLYIVRCYDITASVYVFSNT